MHRCFSVFVKRFSMFCSQKNGFRVWTMESSSKRQREEQNAAGTDRISSLPDSALLHILSFLPTKTCVATNLLSRRWLDLWQHLQVFDFHHDPEVQSFGHFACFVNAVLNLRRNRDIRSFRLRCGYTTEVGRIAKSVDVWVQTAIGPHLEELHLNLSVFRIYLEEEDEDEEDREELLFNELLAYVVPHSLFTCTKLLKLSLCGNIHVRQYSGVCFPFWCLFSILSCKCDLLDQR